MATIDDLWDEPVESEPVPRPTTNPVTSAEDPLFLQSDSENEGRVGAAGPRPSKAPDDIGALFDVDDEDENGQLSNVTYEHLRADARSGGRVSDNGPSGKGSQPEEAEDPSRGALADKFKSEKGDDAGTAGARRTIPKLDEELLLSEKGIPALIKDAKRWRPKGKGHEASFSNLFCRICLHGSSDMPGFRPQPSHSDLPVLGSPDVPPAYFQ